MKEQNLVFYLKKQSYVHASFVERVSLNLVSTVFPMTFSIPVQMYSPTSFFVILRMTNVKESTESLIVCIELFESVSLFRIHVRSPTSIGFDNLQSSCTGLSALPSTIFLLHRKVQLWPKE